MEKVRRMRATANDVTEVGAVSSSTATPSVDPVTPEIIRHSLGSIADEIEVDITRTAYSPLIYEYRDYAVGLLDPDGKLMTHAERGPLIFTADLDLPLRDCLELLATDNAKLGPSDVVLNNYAGVCGQHLNNVNAYCPAYADGELIGYSAVRMHWADVGGKSQGPQRMTAPAYSRRASPFAPFESWWTVNGTGSCCASWNPIPACPSRSWAT